MEDPEQRTAWEALQKVLSDELERRQASSASFTEVMRGFDDFSRVATARFLFDHPTFTAGWIAVRTSPLTKMLQAATSEEDYFQFLVRLSVASPLAGANSECPPFALLPPTLKPRGLWASLLSGLFPPATLERLLEGGFMPLGRRPVESELGAALGREYAIVDTDYGIAVLPPGLPRRNVALDKALLERYLDVVPSLADHPSEIFNVGAARGQACYTGGVAEASDLISVEVSSRSELDEVLRRLRDGASRRSRPLEIWFRGQPREYRLPDLAAEARQGICPWREIPDISQVPSLYRSLADRLADPATFCARLLEIQQFYLFMKETLGIPTYGTRSPEEASQELLARRWGFVRPELTVTVSVPDGGVVEHHDTHQAFRALQAGLFLQHYGMESNILDLTSDIDVALFFAQKRVREGTYVDVEPGLDGPVLYVFLLDADLDPVVSTAELLQAYDVLRPKRQRCGILAGASLISRNYYARFIGLRIVLRGQIQMAIDDPRHYFPPPEEDRFLANLLTFAAERGTSLVRPFTLGPGSEG